MSVRVYTVDYIWNIPDDEMSPDDKLVLHSDYLKALKAIEAAKEQRFANLEALGKLLGYDEAKIKRLNSAYDKEIEEILK